MCSRAIIVKDVYDQLVKKIVDRAKPIKQGAPYESNDIYNGPVVNQDACEKILEYIEHRAERERAILEGVRSGIRRTEDLVARIYTDVPVSFHGMAFFSVEAHLVKLIREGKIGKSGNDEGYEPT